MRNLLRTDAYTVAQLPFNEAVSSGSCGEGIADE
jgi:hypothetical protein